MAILNNDSLTKGVSLPYKKIGCVSGDKNSIQVTMHECSGKEFDPLSGYSVNMSAEQSAELGVKITELAYNFLKENCLISGEDC